MKKGYKAPWIAQEDEASDEQKQHYRSLLERLEEEEEEEPEELVDDDEEEALELDVDEKVLEPKLMKDSTILTLYS